MTYRFMAVHAHPDDESSKGSATLAHYASLGYEVMVVSCTGGERGDILNHELAQTPLAHRDLPGLRRLEMLQAQQTLGVQHRWLGYVDSGLTPGQPNPVNSFADISIDISSQPLVRLIRSFRPHVVLTYDENGGYPHPDHIRCHEITVRAVADAADPALLPELGEAWQVDKLYYDQSFNVQRFSAVRNALAEERPDFDLTDIDSMLAHMEGRESRITTQIEVGEHFGTRDEALRAHASQIPADSFFFMVPNELHARAWPYEDLELVWSKVDTQLPENDIFAGIVDSDDHE